MLPWVKRCVDTLRSAPGISTLLASLLSLALSLVLVGWFDNDDTALFTWTRFIGCSMTALALNLSLCAICSAAVPEYRGEKAALYAGYPRWCWLVPALQQVVFLVVTAVLAAACAGTPLNSPTTTSKLVAGVLAYMSGMQGRELVIMANAPLMLAHHVATMVLCAVLWHLLQQHEGEAAWEGAAELVGLSVGSMEAGSLGPTLGVFLAPYVGRMGAFQLILMSSSHIVALGAGLACVWQWPCVTFFVTMFVTFGFMGIRQQNAHHEFRVGIGCGDTYKKAD